MKNEKYVIESLLFVSGGPLLIDQVKGVLDHLEPQAIRNLFNELKNEYEENGRGIKIVEIAGGFQMVTSPEFSEYLKKYYKRKHVERLSRPALETLAIIAYKQPITRLDIESIRGVNTDGVTRNLSEKGLIRIVGRKDISGRPFVYGTTRQFLEYFGLSVLGELPKIEEFNKLIPANDEKKNSLHKEETSDSSEAKDANTPSPQNEAMSDASGG